jgi:tetratricopeptide (TPR) repeat protein
MSLRSLLVLAALLHAAPAIADLFPVTEKGKELFKQGSNFAAEGKGTEALQSFRAAALADPAAAMPVSQIAYIYYSFSKSAPENEVDNFRAQARSAANAALKLDARDPMAMEVLRLLEDAQAQARHQPKAEATKILHEGEVLFQDGKYAAALEKYTQASVLDPENAEAVLLMGDCHFAQGDLASAELLFRRATEIDPLYSVAWRFVFDAQAKQGNLQGAETAALNAIAAMPSERQSWLRLNMLLEQKGRRLTPFNLVMHARLDKTTISLDPKLPEPESTVWLAYGVVLAGMIDSKTTAFEHDYAAWEKTMRIMDEMKGSKSVKDEALLALQRFYKAGQLKPALLLLTYREAYRPDFEAWKKANPGGIKAFIDTFQIGI